LEVNVNRVQQIILAMTFALTVTGLSAQAQTVLAVEPEFESLVAADAKLEVISEDFGHAGDSPSLEGPVWVKDAKSADGGYLLFSDRPRMQIAKWSPGMGMGQGYDLNKVLGKQQEGASPSSGIALDPQGRVVFCSGSMNAVVRIEKDGKATILAQMLNGNKFNRPNDLTIKSNGSIYFTDNSRDETGKMPPTVYLIKDGKVVPIIKDLVSPNGITLSPDEKVLYVNDIRPRKVYRYDVLEDDTVTNGTLFVDMNGYKEVGSNDGMKTDIQGNLYNSGPGGVWVLSPMGDLLGTIRTPDRITNLSFGGADGKTLFLTGHVALFSIQLKVGGHLRP